MPYSIPSLRQLINTGLQDVEAELAVQLPPMGIEQALNTAVSAAMRDLYDYQRWISRQIVPSHDSDDQTIIEQATAEGVPRKQAAYAVGLVTMTGNKAVPVDVLLNHVDGREYRVLSSSPPQGSQVVVQVRAEVAGMAGNLAAGEKLTLTEAVPSVTPDGVTGAIEGGADLEPIAELLDRLLFRKRFPPTGGAPHDYVAWCREMPGITRAWAYSRWHGAGTVGVAFVYDGRPSMLPTETEQDAVRDYIYRHTDPATGVEVGAPGGVETVFMSLTLKAVPLSVRLVPDTPENRAAVAANLKALQRTLSPGEGLLKTAINTAIGMTTVADYEHTLAADVTAAATELLTIEEVTWLTL